MQNNNDLLPPIEVPPDFIDHETLISVIENFVLREGTDYGATEVSLATKVQQVLRQIKTREAKLYFDPNSDSINLVAPNSWPTAHDSVERDGEY
jgi:uncharacterized protein YheU (UPF0270 family)